MRKLLVFVLTLVSFYSRSQSICAGSSGTLTPTNPSGLGNPQYSLNPGGFTPDQNGNFVVSPNVTTTYTIYTTGTNTNNAQVTTSVVTQVTVNPQPSSTPVFTQATCTNSSNIVNLGLVFSPASPVPGFTVSWLPNPPPTFTLSNQTVINNVPPGPYTVSILAVGGCSTNVTFSVHPQPAFAQYSVLPLGNTHSITCAQPTVVLNTTNANLTYTWTSSSNPPSSSTIISVTMPSTISVVGQNTVSGCTTTFTFDIGLDQTVPSSTISPNLINITCAQAAAPTVTVTSNPVVNISHYIYSPTQGTFAANSFTAIYQIGGIGTYTHCLINNMNGCSVCKTFTVSSNDSYPTYSVSSANNFTLGCGTKSLGAISIDGAQGGGGGAASYTIIGPPTSTAVPPTGTLSSVNLYTMTTPGTWTVIVRDWVNNCETRTPVSVLLKTEAPTISAIVPRQTLDCTYTTTILEGISTTPNVAYTWAFVPLSGPGIVTGNTYTAVINATATAQTLLNNYTLTITDNNNTCKSTSVIPIYQNLFPPKVGIAGTNSITCATPTVVLTNQSATGIPLASGFPTVAPIIGYLWTGPSPQEPSQVNTTYLGATVGIYTLVAKDMNNGCTAAGTFTVSDKKNFPQVNQGQGQADPVTIDCGVAATSLTANVIGNATDFTYSWTPPGSAPTGTNNLRTYSVSVPGDYTVIVTNTSNSCKTKAVLTAIPGSLTAAFAASPETGFAPLSVVFTNNSASSKDNSNITSGWSFGNGPSIYSVTPSASVQPQVLYTQPGTYMVRMFVTKGTCQDTAIGYIKVEIPSSIEIPNVFTPNGDKVNDLFFLKNAKNLVDIDAKIFDRWGHVVYEIKSTTGNIEWDGKNQYGKESAEGTYFYTIKATGSDGQTYDKKGTVSLYR